MTSSSGCNWRVCPNGYTHELKKKGTLISGYICGQSIHILFNSIYRQWSKKNSCRSFFLAPVSMSKTSLVLLYIAVNSNGKVMVIILLFYCRQHETSDPTPTHLPPLWMYSTASHNISSSTQEEKRHNSDPTCKII